jgi:diguanylate cyclase (GGDEF)-like protein
LLDSSGRLIATSTGFTAQAAADLTRSSAVALVRSGHQYGLGNLQPYGRTGAIDYAVAFPTRYGKRILVTGFAPSALSLFLTRDLRKIPGVKGAHNYLLDGNDAVLASTNPAIPVRHVVTQPGAVSALQHQSGNIRGHYFDQVPLTNSTWRIVLAAPDGPLFASVSGLRKWVPWLIFAGFALVALVALALGRRTLRAAEQVRIANARLAHDALHDSLTSLPNRALFIDRVEQVVRRAARDDDVGCAVLFLDVDRFKLVNDSFSHAVGDRLLTALAERVAAVVRPTDTVARLGGDEFTVLLDGVRSEAQAMTVARRIQESLAPPFVIDGHELAVSASIGIAISSEGMDAADLLRNADIAMYEARRHRGEGTALFNEGMHRRVVDRLARERELRRAVNDRLLEVHYQPIVELATGRICWLEALARWPEAWPPVPPAEFIPIAEETGMIGELGLYVMNTALRALAAWRESGLLGSDTKISVNVSGRELGDSAFPRQVRAAVADAGLSGDALRLEMTESTLMQDSARIQSVLSEVCASGVGVHLDDFGTGYSSLTALHQFAVDALKIDRSFVASLDSGDNGADPIVHLTVALAHSLGLRVIAEGIETGEQLLRLQALGCEYGQGYLFSEPLTLEATERMLAGWSGDRVALSQAL